MEMFNKGIGKIGSVEILKVKGTIVDGFIKIDISADLPEVIVAAATKTENKIDDMPAAIAALALKKVTKDLTNTSIGSINGVGITNFKAGIVSGVMEASLTTDIPAVGVELAKETENKIDDMVASLLSQILVALT